MRNEVDIQIWRQSGGGEWRGGGGGVKGVECVDRMKGGEGRGGGERLRMRVKFGGCVRFSFSLCNRSFPLSSRRRSA